MKLILLFQFPDHVIRGLIHYVDSATVYVKNNIISIILILVYHKGFLSFCLWYRQGTCVRQRTFGPLPYPLVFFFIRTGLFPVFAGLITYCAGCLAC